MRVTLTMAVAAVLVQGIVVGWRPLLTWVPSGRWFDLLQAAGAFLGVPAAVLWIGGRRLPLPRFVSALALLVGLLAYVYDVGIAEKRLGFSPSTTICLILGPLGVIAGALSVRSALWRRKQGHWAWYQLFWRVATLLGALTVATASGLNINRSLLPATWDYHVYRIDAAFGDVPALLAAWNEAGPPALQAFTLAVYGLLVFALFALVGLSMRRGMVARLNVWRALVLPFVLAFPLYALLPVSGPGYAFFSGEFPSSMPDPTTVAAAKVIIPVAYRNGMPSMHLAGAILVCMMAIALRHRVAVWAAATLVIATVWSTLATGEHYLLDLIVAVPYAVFLGTSIIRPSILRAARGIGMPAWVCVGVFIAWLALLLVAPTWLSLNLWFVRGLAALGVLAAGTALRNFVRAADPLIAEPRVSTLPSSSGNDGAPRWVIILFAASGIAGLIYEVVYAKALAVTFGSTALASYTVLATYMGGMALGAWLGGRLADRVHDPLKAYALCEMFIGLYAAATPQLFQLIQQVYVAVAADAAPDATWLTVTRVALGALCLGIPTLCMGATTPLMFKYLRAQGVSSQRAVAPLYGANVVGAALGSVLAGYAILPALGRTGGTMVAAVASLMIALYAIQKSGHRALPVVRASELSDVGPAQEQTPSPRRAGAIALAVLTVGGAVTMGLEVNSIHMLAVVAGNSVYAFALMLATFLAGLGLGSHIGANTMRRIPRMQVVALAQCGLVIAIAGTAHVWDLLPGYFSSFQLYPIKLDFSARELVRAMVCTLAMLPPAFFIGASYPAAMSLASDWLSPHGGARGFGLASAMNTLGNITGVLAVGFWLLPGLGSLTTSLTMALVALALALLASMAARSVRRPDPAVRHMPRVFGSWVPLGVAVVSLAVFPSRWDYDELSTGSNVYFARQSWGKVIDSAESVAGGLTTVARADNGMQTLLTNGKFQGNDAPGGEMVAQESFALFPLLHTPARNSALVIGYGTGMTARVLHDVGFGRVEIAELSSDIVEMANRHFESINHHVSEQPGVKTYITDGRNFLLTQSRRFDLISIEITSIWFAGAANLYNRDFYALAKRRLSDNGVLQQWVQLHHISPIDLAYVLGSVRSEFRDVWLYVRGGQGIIVASNRDGGRGHTYPLKIDALHRNGALGINVAELRSHQLLSPAGVDNFIGSIDPSFKLIVSTDQNLYLEHSTPKGNALGDVLAQNVALLARFEPRVQQDRHTDPADAAPSTSAEMSR